MRTPRDLEAPERREYLEANGWLWKWKRAEEAPQPAPRKLFADDGFMLMRPRIRRDE